MNEPEPHHQDQEETSLPLESQQGTRRSDQPDFYDNIDFDEEFDVVRSMN